MGDYISTPDGSRPFIWFENGLWYCGSHKYSVLAWTGRSAWDAFCARERWLRGHQ